MKYLISMYVNPAVLAALPDERREALFAAHGGFMELVQGTGEFVTTLALAEPEQAAVVAVRGGQTVVTDGPFAEAKEFLGGFYLVEVADRARAVELAAMIPDAGIEGLAVEIREVVFQG